MNILEAKMIIDGKLEKIMTEGIGKTLKILERLFTN